MSIKENRKVFKNFKILIILNSSLLLFALFYTAYFLLTKDTEREIVCAFKEVFGIYCPGCGGSRSLYFFLKFDFVNAFIYYPPIIISAITVLSYDIMLIITIIKKDTRLTDSYKFYPFLLIPISIILTFIIRLFLIHFGIDPLGDIIV